MTVCNCLLKWMSLARLVLTIARSGLVNFYLSFCIHYAKYPDEHCADVGLYERLNSDKTKERNIYSNDKLSTLTKDLNISVIISETYYQTPLCFRDNSEKIHGRYTFDILLLITHYLFTSR